VLTCAKINIILGLLVSFILIVFGKYFVYIFITNPTNQEIYYVSEYLKISAIFFVFVSVIFVFRNTLQGMGYPNIPILSAISELLARSIVAFTLPNYIGYLGVCFANPISWIFASSILMYFSYKKIKALN
jgi:Na+-driven multidrug efflux pump